MQGMLVWTWFCSFPTERWQSLLLMMIPVIMLVIMKTEVKMLIAIPGASECVDIDECLVANGGCQHDCHNTEGGHRCSCRFKQWQWEDTYCGNDIRHHDYYNNWSSRHHGDDDNHDGNHRSGWALLPDSRLCGDLNECTRSPNNSHQWDQWHGRSSMSMIILPPRNNGGCSHLCTNTAGGFSCSCPPNHQVSILITFIIIVDIWSSVSSVSFPQLTSDGATCKVVKKAKCPPIHRSANHKTFTNNTNC